ncbi:MAG TPA: bifunctional DedA family/phosphatase PAP2 family protein [Solirubrobacteraceae bacterium]|nr:bifunctional DedA family/phosphatase PAP2 family protein [Solirubrobacteraceae bacterium]
MKPVWLVAAVALAAFLVWRRRKLEPTLLAGGAIAVVGMAVYGTGLVHLPNVEESLIRVGETLGAWTYLLVGALAFAETGAFVGLIAPGETAMMLGGLVAGQGQISVVTLIGIVWACAVAGDVTSFLLGRRLGRSFLVRHGEKVRITEERLQTVERFFDRHGGKAILIGRFVGLVRAIAPFLAGSSGMSLRRFVPYDVVGAGLWGTTFVVLGYVFWQSFSTLVDYAKKGALALGTALVVIVGLVWLGRWVRSAENRERARVWIERQAERRGLRPVAKVLRPVLRQSEAPARFVWDRVTPGDLGLEVTTLVAVLSVGLYSFVAHIVKLENGETPIGDDRALDLVERLDAEPFIGVAKVVSELGSLPVAIALVLVSSVALIWRREFVEALLLGVGLTITYGAVQIAKDALDRPPPDRPLIETDLSAYPSVHAAYAVTWVAVAVALSRALPNIASRFAFVIIAVVIAVLVGLSRLYLRAHWLSDVTGGWGLASAIFALAGLVALVVAYVRDNARDAPRRPAPEAT